MRSKLMKGNSRDIIDTNIKHLCENGCSEMDATRIALRHAKRGSGKTAVKKVVRAVRKGY